MKVYTYKNVQFLWGGKLNIYLPNSLFPLPKRQCNGVLYWQLANDVRLSINQFKKIIRL